MGVKLDPSVLDKLRADLGLKNFEQIGQKVGKTAYTVRNWYHGRTVPTATDLVKLQYLTGRPYGTMLIINEKTQAA